MYINVTYLYTCKHEEVVVTDIGTTDTIITFGNIVKTKYQPDQSLPETKVRMRGFLGKQFI